MTNIPLHTIINKNPKSLRRLDSLNIPLISPINLPTIFQKNIGCISWEYIVKILINLSSNSSINLSIIWYLLWKNLLGYWRVFYFEMLLKFFKKFKYLKHFWPVGGVFIFEWNYIVDTYLKKYIFICIWKWLNSSQRVRNASDLLIFGRILEAFQIKILFNIPENSSIKNIKWLTGLWKN